MGKSRYRLDAGRLAWHNANMPDTVVLIASGDLRLSANQECWPAQAQAEEAVMNAIRRQGREVRRGNACDPVKQHGFIDSQKYGMEVFSGLPPDAPLVVVEAVWQYSHHILHGLYTHQGPILTVANWSGQWPGLVGMLNLNACMTKAGIQYSTLWSQDFTDEFFLSGLRQWLSGETVRHNVSHTRALAQFQLPARAVELGARLARELRRAKAIMGIFDEGCMGMYNAIIPDELLHATGVFKERISQSALFAEMQQVSDAEAQAVRGWLDAKGMKFVTGPNPETDLTDAQILSQCKMYLAALRMADDFGCDTIGIQYQQGLKDLAPASDLAEGLLNNVDRPLATNRIWKALGYDPETTLHDIRYGEPFGVNGREEFVWVFQISGAVPPAHLTGGYAGAVSERQPAMYFRLGGGSLKGVCKPGEIVWSRIFVEGGKLKADLGRARAIALPPAETERRWRMTTPQWPIMHAVLYGVTRDQLMARHKSNHIQVAYAPDAAAANLALAAKAAMFREMGLEVA